MITIFTVKDNIACNEERYMELADCNLKLVFYNCVPNCYKNSINMIIFIMQRLFSVFLKCVLIVSGVYDFSCYYITPSVE